MFNFKGYEAFTHTEAKKHVFRSQFSIADFKCAQHFIEAQLLSVFSLSHNQQTEFFIVEQPWQLNINFNWE